MQVNKQPSPWPCVVMLVGLLLFCLVVPSYWEQEQPSPAGAALRPQPRKIRKA